MIGRLSPRADDDPFLSSREVAKRISAAFPESLIDEERANEILRAELQILEKKGVPSPILQGHKNLFGNTTCLEVYSTSNVRMGVRFMVYPDSAIEVFAVRPETTSDENGILRQLVCIIANELAYDAEFTS